MTLKEIEADLPNGLHDAQIKRIEIDYEKRTAKFSLLLWTGDLSSEDESLRETYEEGELIIKDFIYCIIEPPDPTYPHSSASPITISAGSTTEQTINPQPKVRLESPEGAFAYWFFVREWNSFIHIAGMDASMQLYTSQNV
jgi:hypothetical protein